MSYYIGTTPSEVQAGFIKRYLNESVIKMLINTDKIFI